MRMELSLGTVQAGPTSANIAVPRQSLIVFFSFTIRSLRVLCHGLSVDDARGDEDEQLLSAVRLGCVLEEEAEDRNLPQQRNRGHGTGAAAHVDAADHRRVAVLYQDLRLRFLARDPRLPVGAGVRGIR